MRRFTSSIIACISLFAGPVWAQQSDALRLLDGYGNRITSTDGKLNVHPDASGGGAVTQYDQGTSDTSTDVLMMAGCVRKDTPTLAAGVIDGDRSRCIVDSTGKLWVNIGSISAITSITNPVTVTDGAGSLNTIIDSGTLTAVTSITNPVAVTGTFWQATQPVSGTFWQATQPISAASLPLPTGAALDTSVDGIEALLTSTNSKLDALQTELNQKTEPANTQIVGDGSGPLTIDGTITVNAGTNLNTSALLLDATFTGRINTQGQKAMSASTPVVLSSDQSSLPVTEQSSSAVVSGQQAVTASAVALPTNAAKEVCVKALIANGLNIYVGPSGVTTSTGIELAPGDGWCTRVTNTNALFVIASSTGSSVSFSGRN